MYPAACFGGLDYTACRRLLVTSLTLFDRMFESLFSCKDCFECICARCEREAANAEALTAAAAELRQVDWRLEPPPPLRFSSSSSLLSSHSNSSPSLIASPPNDTWQVRGGLEGVHAGGTLGEEHAGAMERCSSLLDQLTPVGTSHPELACILMRLGGWWLRLYDKATPASDPRPKGSARKGKGGKRDKQRGGSGGGGDGGEIQQAQSQDIQQARLGYLQKAVAHLRQARSMITVSLGAEHPMLAALEASLQRAEVVAAGVAAGGGGAAGVATAAAGGDKAGAAAGGASQGEPTVSVS